MYIQSGFCSAVIWLLWCEGSIWKVMGCLSPPRLELLKHFVLISSALPRGEKRRRECQEAIVHITCGVV